MDAFHYLSLHDQSPVPHIVHFNIAITEKHFSYAVNASPPEALLYPATPTPTPTPLPPPRRPKQNEKLSLCAL